MQGSRSVWFVCGALILSVAAFSISQGLTYPLLAFIMESRDESTAAIALNAAMTPLGIIVSAPIISKWAPIFPRGPAIICSICTTVAILLLIGIANNTTAWLFLRFVLGCSASAVYVLSEASLLTVAPEQHRGRIMGAYTSITTLGYAVGPLILIVAGTDGLAPFLVTSAVLCLAMAPLMFVKVVVEQPEEPGEGLRSILAFLRIAGILVAAYATTTLFDNGFMTLFPSYGLANGLTENNISMLLTVLLLGGAVFQIPIGWGIDKISSAAILGVCTMVGSLGFAFVGFVLDHFALSLVFSFFWGAAVLGVQTVALAELGKRYTGAVLLSGNATIALMWGLSGVVGVPLSGVGMSVFGPNGLLIVIGGLFAAATCVFTIEVASMRRAHLR